MSNIQTYLNYIMTKTYGEEVCQAICDAISTCYNDVNTPTLNREGFTAVLTEMASSGALANSLMDYLGILTEDTSNFVNLLTSTVGRLNTSTGVIDTTATTYTTSGYIPVTQGTTYYFTSTDRRVFYTGSAGSETYSQNIQSGTSFQAPSNGWIRVSFTNANRGVVKVNEGSNKAYRPGRTAVDYNLRDTVSTLISNLTTNYYDKSSINTMFDNIDISLTTEQKNALIALLD